jgi:hypothetical protein
MRQRRSERRRRRWPVLGWRQRRSEGCGRTWPVFGRCRFPLRHRSLR